jgi:hypothetical protein
VALVSQPRYGSTEPMGLELRYPNLWLVVPPALLDLAYTLNQARGSTDWGAGLFGPNNEHIIVNTLFTDANDWGVHWDAGRLESIRLAYLDSEEPLVTPHGTGNGELFRKDVQQYRISQSWTVALSDYRAATKSVVA